MQRGDVITKVNNRPLRRQRDVLRFQEMIMYGEIGEMLSLEIYRGRKDISEFKKLNVRIGKRPDPIVKKPRKKKPAKKQNTPKDEDSTKEKAPAAKVPAPSSNN